MAIRRALISVSDKTGVIALARGLAALGIEIISTGGTAKGLLAEGIAVMDVASVTGFPEIMDGRVKTLHPKIHGGLLAVRDDAGHVRAQAQNGIANIDMLVVNLYPFAETVARGAGWDEIIENIDVGGPAMIRAAAKNHRDVTVVVDPLDYDKVLGEMQDGDGDTTLPTRRWLAAKAFSRTSAYDAAIAQWFASEMHDPFPPEIVFFGQRVQELRYGENPHQSAALYGWPGQPPGIATARQLQGKQLSYNNLNDTDAALECLSEFDPGEGAACVIVKHANPCGVAVGGSLLDAYRKALACDPVSAFGGIVALNRPLDTATAAEIIALFTEVIVAPSADPDAVALVAGKKNLRLLLSDASAFRKSTARVLKTVSGGFLLQTRDDVSVDDMDLKVVTRRPPDARELADLRFAFRVAKHVKSNAIVYAKDGATVGIGAGQMSRVDSARIAARKSTDAALGGVPLAKGSVVASDAFFPFADGLLQAIEAGATAVIQPGGSIKDDEVIRVADEAGIAMVFTGFRHFRH